MAFSLSLFSHFRHLRCHFPPKLQSVAFSSENSKWFRINVSAFRDRIHHSWCHSFAAHKLRAAKSDKTICISIFLRSANKGNCLLSVGIYINKQNKCRLRVVSCVLRLLRTTTIANKINIQYVIKAEYVCSNVWMWPELGARLHWHDFLVAAVVSLLYFHPHKNAPVYVCIRTTTMSFHSVNYLVACECVCVREWVLTYEERTRQKTSER